MTETDKHIRATLIREDGCTCTYEADSWLRFAQKAVDQADSSWGGYSRIVRVFGVDISGSGGLEEHTISSLRDAIPLLREEHPPQPERGKTDEGECLDRERLDR